MIGAKIVALDHE